MGLLQGSAEQQGDINQSVMVPSSFRAGVGDSKPSQIDRESRDIIERSSNSWIGSKQSRKKVLQQGLFDGGKGMTNVRNNPLEIGPLSLKRLGEGSTAKSDWGCILAAPESSLTPSTYC